MRDSGVGWSNGMLSHSTDISRLLLLMEIPAWISWMRGKLTMITNSGDHQRKRERRSYTYPAAFLLCMPRSFLWPIYWHLSSERPMMDSAPSTSFSWYGVPWIMWPLVSFIWKRILLRYFTPLVTAITLLLLGLDTNLYYYSTHKSAMSHTYNFVLITVFFHTLLRWYEKASWLRTFLLEMLFGLIVLIRPTNFLIFILFILWGVDSWTTFKERVRYFLRNVPKVLLMIFAFLLPWISQFLYWKMMTGQFLYYSYGAHWDRFYFDNPHIIESLFSYWKGWLLYNPLMIFAIIGLVPLKRVIRGAWLPIILYLVLLIYVMSCWWT